MSASVFVSIQAWGGQESYRVRAVRAHEEQCEQCGEARFTGAALTCDMLRRVMTEPLASPLLQTLLQPRSAS